MNQCMLESGIRDYELNFINYWNKIFSEYKKDTTGNKMWMAGPTSYVFSLAGQKFAVDLQIRRKEDFEVLLPQLISDTDEISFVLITHQHDDHMCIPLINALKDTPIRWYIPHDCTQRIIDKLEVKPENLIMVKPGDTFTVGDITVNAFETPHARPHEEYYPERGYAITTPQGKIIMPADVRNYDYDGYPDFEKVDLCFSHVWASDNSSNPESYMPMMEKFARFNAAFDAKKYFLCHLFEIARDESHMWHYGHAGIAMNLLYSLVPRSTVEIPKVGNSYYVFDNPEE